MTSLIQDSGMDGVRDALHDGTASEARRNQDWHGYYPPRIRLCLCNKIIICLGTQQLLFVGMYYPHSWDCCCCRKYDWILYIPDSIIGCQINDPGSSIHRWRKCRFRHHFRLGKLTIIISFFHPFIVLLQTHSSYVTRAELLCWLIA